ncbi:hypothetical protein DTO217A2_1939 [Paecilomyces variotii]|nr:hypothetical protein DTO217A2_1939 [Paecilomyces variotii]KAJ9373201.1 hypothetical protein DTO282E5_2268 [Paecilomyces variotii]KAJ9394451.1 hypothetical protein DTO282F9_8627 [Paecilomyces variotii]
MLEATFVVSLPLHDYPFRHPGEQAARFCLITCSCHWSLLAHKSNDPDAEPLPRIIRVGSQIDSGWFHWYLLYKQS